TGFKGAWTALVLHRLGAKVVGLALDSAYEQGVFTVASVANVLDHRIGDIRDLPGLERCFAETQPDVVFHMAAQSLVRRSYAAPIDTYAVNVTGTVNLLECVRRAESVRAAIIVTSDKCYRNEGNGTAFRESDPLGGHDPYSSSKACAELVADAY